MSFEGRYQLWCKNGHYTEMDCYAYEQDEMECWCNLPFIRSNLIDDTNGEEQGKIEPILLEEKRCEHCGSIIEQIYEIPLK